MPRPLGTTFADLLGKLTVVRVECSKCGRFGRYPLHRLIRIKNDPAGASAPRGRAREYFTSDIPSITDIARTSRDFRVVPTADSCTAAKESHSITSSAVPSRCGSNSRPSVGAVLRLMTSANLVDCCN